VTIDVGDNLGWFLFMLAIALCIWVANRD